MKRMKVGIASIAIIVGAAIAIGAVGYVVLHHQVALAPTTLSLTPMPSLLPFESPIPTNFPSPVALPKPVVSSSATKTVFLGEEFTLKKGETARIKDKNAFLHVKSFIYSPCPADKQCYWSGLGVTYELTVDGKVYSSATGNQPTGAPYKILMKKSDYKTYATFVIN